MKPTFVEPDLAIKKVIVPKLEVKYSDISIPKAVKYPVAKMKRNVHMKSIGKKGCKNYFLEINMK